jgi:hypothetical protein
VWTITDDVDFNHLAQVVFVMFLYCEVFLYIQNILDIIKKESYDSSS